MKTKLQNWFLKGKCLLSDSKNCAKDQLLIEDDLGRSHTLCGVETTPPRMTFYGHQVKLSFRSDSSITYKGFYLRYSLSPLPKGMSLL